MKKRYISRKDSIILSAIDIINELGFNELSIREIANRQGISEPAIYRHFKSKQDIVIGVLEYYARFDIMLKNTIKEKDINPKEAILFLIKAYCEYFENYPALTAIPFTYDILSYDPIVSEYFNSISNVRFKVLYELIEEGKRQQVIHSRFSSEDFTDLIWGMVRTMLSKWRIKKYSFSLKEKVIELLQKLIEI